MIKLPKIYYISQGDSPEAHIKHINDVCESGCKLIQLRLKNVSAKKLQATADEAYKICEKHNASLIINDHIELIDNNSSKGLHLGKNDTELAKAKLALPNIIVGGTANTLEDCIRLHKEGADYIGLGPLRFTSTKSNLDPILGFDGYKEIINKLNALKIHIPIYAIGGIEATDIQPLLEIGIYGVAISGLLTKQTIAQNKKLIKQYE